MQAIVEEIKSIALERHGKNKSGQLLEEQGSSAKKVTRVEIDYSWLNGKGTGINAVRDATLRKLLSLEPLLEAASAVVTASAVTRGRSAVDDTESENEDDNDAKRGTSEVDKVGVLTEQTTPAQQPAQAAALSAAAIAGQSTQVAPAGRGGAEGGGKSSVVGAVGAGGVKFSSQHLAEVLSAAFPNLEAMVQAVKAKSELSSKSAVAHTKGQLAESIANHLPDPAKLLSWLIEVCVEWSVKVSECTRST